MQAQPVGAARARVRARARASRGQAVQAQPKRDQSSRAHEAAAFSACCSDREVSLKIEQRPKSCFALE